MDWNAIADDLVSMVTSGLPAFATLIGLVVGIPLVYRIAKRFFR